MQAKEFYREGKLSEAIAAALEDVKAHPGEAGARGFLCQLLCFAGELERAERQLDALAQIDAKVSVGVSLVRHLLRAEQARRQFLSDGRLPEFLEPPPPELKSRIEAAILLREKKPAEAAAALERAESHHTPVSGVCDGKPFDDFRDLDDLCGSSFEVFTSNGKYYQIPFAKVELVEFHPPEDIQDLLWRTAHMVVREGPDGKVYLPALYCGTHASSDDRLRLGRATDWQGGDGAPARGVGQRMFLAGDREAGILEIKTIEFRAAGA